MRIPKRDVFATGLVVAAGLLYLLWATGAVSPGLSGTRATGVVVLALGFAASASAVVPGFDQMIHGNKVYLVTTSLVGLVAFAGGVQMLLVGSEVGLGLVMGAMAVLWLVATIHHVHLGEAATAAARPTAAPSQHRPRAA